MKNVDGAGDTTTWKKTYVCAVAQMLSRGTNITDDNMML